MKNLSIFSKKLGTLVPITATTVGGSVVANERTTNFTDWVNRAWNNYSSGWVNSGWNNYSSGWVNSGWNNYSSGWVNSGWNNYGGGK